MSVTVLATDEYEASTYDAALVREETVVCVTAGETIRLVPLVNVVSVEGDPANHLHGPELPGWFYGGGEYGLVDLDAFPDLRDHVEGLEREP